VKDFVAPRLCAGCEVESFLELARRVLNPVSAAARDLDEFIFSDCKDMLTVVG